MKQKEFIAKNLEIKKNIITTTLTFKRRKYECSIKKTFSKLGLSQIVITDYLF